MDVQATKELSASGSLAPDQGPMDPARGFASRPPLEARHHSFRPVDAPAVRILTSLGRTEAVVVRNCVNVR